MIKKSHYYNWLTRYLWPVWPLYSPPGVISRDGVWLIISPRGYMYIHNSRIKVIWQMLTEWERDCHIVG